MDLEKSLRIAMAMRGVKQQEFADGMEVTRQQVSNWLKSGVMKQENLIKSSKFFNMKVSEFLALGEK